MSQRFTGAAATLALLVAAVAAVAAVRPAPPQRAPSLATLAYRVHDMDRMIAFYSEAFGARFRTVQTGPITSRFAEVAGITLKFVPIRETADFTGFPVHQPGFTVADVQAVIAIAERHGGRVQDAPARRDGRLVAAIRDPDGNTIELYGR